MNAAEARIDPGSPLYLDHAATTPVDPRVVAAMLECLGDRGTFGNPASATHAFGRAAAARVAAARAQVAELIGAGPEQIVFTSGATEANNLALLGMLRPNRDRGRHLVTCRTEHRAVLDPVRELEREGFEVSWITPARDGRIDPQAIGAALRPDTGLVSVMHVNNEIGVIADLAAIGALCRERNVLFHSDAAQGVGKERIDVGRIGIDLLSFTAHKLYGPKGIGALWIGERARPWLKPILYGGGHERGLRSGTLPTHQIVGFGLACALAGEALADERERLRPLRERLWEGLRTLGGVERNGDPEHSVAGLLNVSIEGVEGESLIAALPGLAVSSGSACASASAEPSYVLRALGRRPALAQSSLRLSLGRATTAQDIDRAVSAVRHAVSRLRAVAPGGPVASGRPVSPGGLVACGRGSGTPGDGPPAPVPAAGFDALSAEVRGLFERLPGAGAFPPEAGEEIVGAAGSEAAGARVVFRLLVSGDTVKDARFQAWGCPHTLAAAAWITSQLPGRARDCLAPGAPEGWRAQLAIPVEKLGRLLLIEDSLRDCVQHWPASAVT